MFLKPKTNMLTIILTYDMDNLAIVFLFLNFRSTALSYLLNQFLGLLS